MNQKSKDLKRTSHKSSTGGSAKDATKVLIGALAGAAAGSAIGAIFTKKGIEVRTQVSEGSKNAVKNLKNKVADVTENIADKYEAVKEKTADLIKKGKQKVRTSSDNTAHKSSESVGAKGKGSKILLGTLAVSVAGSIIWVFAAKKGIETRKHFGKSSKNMAKNLKEKITNIADDIADTYETAKEGAEDLIEQGKQKVEMPASQYDYRDDKA